MTFTMQIAGSVVQVTPVRPYIKDFVHDYLCEDTATPDIVIRITQEDIDRERRLAESEARTSRTCPQRLALQRLLSARLLDYDTLLIHGSCVAVDGKGYLFTAPSGTGKSTHTRLWREMLGSRATMVNDDKPFVRITEDGVTAYGSPWNGSHRLGSNVAVPLKAVCLLSRSEANSIHPIAAEDAFPVLCEQVHRPEGEETTGKVVVLLKQLCSKLRLFALACNMQPEAAQVAYNGMSGL